MSTPSLLDVAAEARSVLARPSQIRLTIGSAHYELDHRDGVVDVSGAPSLAVPAGSPVAEHAERGLAAQLRVRSGLDGPADPARRQTLTLSGRLGRLAVQDCDCCDRTQHLLALRPDFVLLTTWARVDNPDYFPGRPVRVPLSAYGSPAYDLSRGFLQTLAEHTTAHHHLELFAWVTTLTGERPAAVTVAGLDPEGVWLQWVDPTGGHRRRLRFERSVRTRPELSTALTGLLGLSLC